MIDEGEQDGNRSRVVLVTGVSGAGKTSTLKALEDLGYEAVDNVPIGRDPFTRPDRHTVAGPELRDRDVYDAAVVAHLVRFRRHQADQRFERT